MHLGKTLPEVFAVACLAADDQLTSFIPLPPSTHFANCPPPESGVASYLAYLVLRMRFLPTPSLVTVVEDQRHHFNIYFGPRSTTVCCCNWANAANLQLLKPQKRARSHASQEASPQPAARSLQYRRKQLIKQIRSQLPCTFLLYSVELQGAGKRTKNPLSSPLRFSPVGACARFLLSLSLRYCPFKPGP
jgi:hypothetical protein